MTPIQSQWKRGDMVLEETSEVYQRSGYEYSLRTTLNIETSSCSLEKETVRCTLNLTKEDRISHVSYSICG